ncbi:ring-cleaving dioxygenase [Microvirga tunisiensis]|uniref:Ring-cleaving dioxygenase n=1 Tax=Pannonibacter tanglangensis TaxID=2750084 RepID=A0A7X5J9N5_9HYPH|nr:VOC family protein [Pannonibacter sp. XCT-53]NBN78480.1 ring-cleaving dioxygenase [Pannonibacter sp. XCT-53]
MLNQIRGLHHVTSIAGDAAVNNAFFTRTLGLRRVKKTVNFDAPDVYHLYYGDETGSPGTVMTYFPFPGARGGRPGTGEVGTTVFAVPRDAIGYWKERLGRLGVDGLAEDTLLGQKRLHLAGPDGDGFALVEVEDDARQPWTGSDVPADVAIRGFHSTALRLRDGGATGELLRFMGYEASETAEGLTRYRITGGNGAHVIDVEVMPNIAHGVQGAGSVHHVAFAVENRAAQLEVRKALMDTGFQVTPVIDRDYFYAIYFRTPGGVLFEIATNEPGFSRDEDTAHLGEALRLPAQHAHLRPYLEAHLQKLEG